MCFECTIWVSLQCLELFEGSETRKLFCSQSRLSPIWLAITLKNSPSEAAGLGNMQFSIEDIVKSLRRVGKDVDQIVRLNSEENLLVAELLDSLKHVYQQMLSLGVSTSALPIGL